MSTTPSFWAWFNGQLIQIQNSETSTQFHSSQTYEETQRYIEAEEKAGRVFVIRPQTSLNVGRLTRDPEAVQYAYDCGVKDAQAKLNDLLNWKWKRRALI